MCYGTENSTTNNLNVLQHTMEQIMLSIITLKEERADIWIRQYARQEARSDPGR